VTIITAYSREISYAAEAPFYEREKAKEVNGAHINDVSSRLIKKHLEQKDDGRENQQFLHALKDRKKKWQ
jgi:hypothetical protein